MFKSGACDNIYTNIYIGFWRGYISKSTFYSEETAKYKIPNSKREKFEECTHLLVMEDTNKFIKEVENFIVKNCKMIQLCAIIFILS